VISFCNPAAVSWAESLDARRNSAVEKSAKSGLFPSSPTASRLPYPRRARRYLTMLKTLPLVVAVAGAFTVAAACGRSPAAPAATPSAVPAAALSLAGAAPPAVMTASAGRDNIMVNMHDACDPATFNAAIGPDSCLRNGGVTFDQFVAQLTQRGSIGAWHFAPGVANARVGETFLASNTGGEVHTFTEVAQFGGGIVPFLNQLSGTPNVAPECSALEPDDFVAPGGTYHEAVDHSGTVKFQCCIHPWMRLEAQVR
jgi:plastocyanin